MGLQHRLLWELSKLGERIHVDALTYNPIIFDLFDRTATQNAPGVISAVVRTFPAANQYVDVGAGSGAYAAEANRRGHPTLAYERSPIGRRMAHEKGVRALPLDLAAPPQLSDAQHFDLAYCIEVAEHVPASFALTLVSFLGRLASTVVFTAAPPGQGGTGHINERPPSYWQSLFTQAGMFYQEHLTDQLKNALRGESIPATYIIDNAIVFQR